MCCQNLSDDDHQQISRVESCEDLISSLSGVQQKMTQKTGPGLVHQLRPSLDALRSFVTLLTASIGSSTVETALIWGIMSLVIHVGSHVFLFETTFLMSDATSIHEKGYLIIVNRQQNERRHFYQKRLKCSMI